MERACCNEAKTPDQSKVGNGISPKAAGTKHWAKSRRRRAVPRSQPPPRLRAGCQMRNHSSDVSSQCHPFCSVAADTMQVRYPLQLLFVLTHIRIGSSCPLIRDGEEVVTVRPGHTLAPGRQRLSIESLRSLQKLRTTSHDHALTFSVARLGGRRA